MRIWLDGRRLHRSALLVAFLLLLPHQAAAESCLFAPARLSDGTLQAFKQRPGDLLERFPGGGPAMSSEVMRLAGSDTALLPAIIDLARKGGIAHRVAIGIGLAKAAMACGRVNPALEQVIKQAVADSGLSDVATAFAAGLSSLELSAATTSTQPAGGSGLAGGGPATSESGSDSPRSGGGGGGESSVELLTAPMTTSFTSRGITSTMGDTVSPTRP